MVAGSCVVALHGILLHSERVADTLVVEVELEVDSAIGIVA
jgi:hypothetical protein